MKKIDFSKFCVFTDITREKTAIVDVRKQLADAIYRNACGIEAHDLALRIYRSDGVVVLDEDDERLLRDFAKTLTPLFMDSFEVNLKSEQGE